MLSMLGRTDEALDALEASFNKGFVHEWIVDAYVGSNLLLLEDNVRFKMLRDKLHARNQQALAYIKSREKLI
jgi:hypothetical protein